MQMDTTFEELFYALRTKNTQKCDNQWSTDNYKVRVCYT